MTAEKVEERARAWLVNGYSPDKAYLERFMERYNNAEGKSDKEKVLNGLYDDSPYGTTKRWCSSVTVFARAVLNSNMTKCDIDHYWIQLSLKANSELEGLTCHQCGSRIYREAVMEDVVALQNLIKDLRKEIYKLSSEKAKDRQTLVAVFNHIGSMCPIPNFQQWRP